MSKFCINDLPPEIIINIFQFLDEVQWVNTALTCKLWNNLIETSCLWTLRLDYNKLYKQKFIDFILTTNRKFGTIKMRNSHLSKDTAAFNIFRVHGINVVKLSFRKCYMSNLTTFAESLKLMPNLKHVHASELFFHDASDVPPDWVLPELKKLREVKMKYCDPSIMKCFNRAKVTTTKLFENNEMPDSASLVDFLKSQEMLTSLSTNNMFKSSSILVEMGKLAIPVKFKLTELAMSDTMWVTETSNEYNCILRFLSSQAANLERLQIGIGFPRSVYKFVLENMTNLETLSLRISQIPREKEFCERLKDNCSVRTLILHCWAESSEYKEIVPHSLKKLSNIHRLILPDRYRNELYVVQSLSKLESLYVRHVDERSFDGAQFRNLKSLQIARLSGKIDWHELTTVHTQLTELTIAAIRNESLLTTDDINEIATNLIDLQSLRLGSGFKADERFFEIIREKCTKLKVFDLAKSCVPYGGPNYNTHHLLRLCDGIKCTKYFCLLGR